MILKFHIAKAPVSDPSGMGLGWVLTHPDGYTEYANSQAAAVHQMDRAVHGSHHHLNTARDVF